MNTDEIENIRARLKSYKCSLCRKWLTPKEKRPPTCTPDDGMCDCRHGSYDCRHRSYGSHVPDVDDEDVECLLEELDTQSSRANAIAVECDRLEAECEKLQRKVHDLNDVLALGDGRLLALRKLLQEYVNCGPLQEPSDYNMGPCECGAQLWDQYVVTRAAYVDGKLTQRLYTEPGFDDLKDRGWIHETVGYRPIADPKHTSACLWRRTKEAVDGLRYFATGRSGP